MKLRVLLSLAITTTLLGCGSSDPDPSPSPDSGEISVATNSGESQVPASGGAEGNYNVSVTSDTEFDINGGTCGNGTGTLVIENSVITGTAMSTNGVQYTIGGQTTDTGEVRGGAFSVGGNSSATYEGVFGGGSGSGTWSDVFQCRGTWQAQLTS